MAEGFRAEIDIPPSLNNAYRNVPGVGRVATANLRRWKHCAGWQIKALHPPRITGPYHFRIELPAKMRGDVSNRIKLAEDLLVRLGVTPDDRKAVSSAAVRTPDMPPDRCVVEVRSAAEGGVT